MPTDAMRDAARLAVQAAWTETYGTCSVEFAQKLADAALAAAEAAAPDVSCSCGLTGAGRCPVCMTVASPA